MSENKQEIVNINDLKVPVYRDSGDQPYAGYVPPDGNIYFVVPKSYQVPEIIKYVQDNFAQISYVQDLVKKRYKNGASLKCRFDTGDVVYFMGRPCVIRVTPIKNPKPLKNDRSRGRASIKANLNPKTSLFDLTVLKSGNFDQRRIAFMAYATLIFKENAERFIFDASERLGNAIREHGVCYNDVFKHVQIRPMRNRFISIQNDIKTVSVNEQLLSFPSYCLVYEFVKANLEIYEEKHPEIQVAYSEIMKEVCPNEEKARGFLSDESCQYWNQWRV